MASNVQGKDQLADDTYVQNKSSTTSTKPATGLKATDSDVAAQDPAVGDSSNPIVEDLLKTVGGDDLSNMSSSKKPQQSNVESVN